MPSSAASKGNGTSGGAVSSELATRRAAINASSAKEGEKSQDAVMGDLSKDFQHIDDAVKQMKIDLKSKYQLQSLLLY